MKNCSLSLLAELTTWRKVLEAGPSVTSVRAVFISDVHSNLEALETVLADLGSEKVYCLGDLVGYGADPNEVVNLLRTKGAEAITGNHDYAAVTGDTGNFSVRAAIAAKWTRRKLTDENAAYLRGLPKMTTLDLDGISVCLTHGSPDDQLWEYVDSATHSQLFGHYLVKLGVRGLALGHTHIPYSWNGPDGTVFNPGSVGQPRDGDWRASYALGSVENGALTIEHCRVEYDVERAAEKIRAAGLPEQLASRLLVGR